MEQNQNKYFDGATLQIVNWEKYNPRADTKKPSWFRFENSFFYSPSFHNFDNNERMVTISLWCLASQKNDPRVTLKTQYLADSSRVPLEKVFSALQKLEKEQVIKLNEMYNAEAPVQNPHGPVRDLHGSVQITCSTNERTNERTNEQGSGAKKEKSTPTLSDEIGEAQKVWSETLVYFKIDRGLIEAEKLQIAQAVQRHGAEAVKLSLVGKRFEKPFKDYVPAQHLNLSKILASDKFQSYVNLGSQHMTKIALKQQELAAQKEPEPEYTVRSVAEIIEESLKRQKEGVS